MKKYNFTDYIKVEEELLKLGISIRTEDGKFRTLYDVLANIANKFNEEINHEACQC